MCMGQSALQIRLHPLTAKTLLVPPNPCPDSHGRELLPTGWAAAHHSGSAGDSFVWAAGAAPRLMQCWWWAGRRAAWQTDAAVALGQHSRALRCTTRGVKQPGGELRAGRASVDWMPNDDGNVMLQGSWHTSIQTTRLSVTSSGPEEKFNRRWIGRRSWRWVPRAGTAQDRAGHRGHGWSQAAEPVGRHRGASGLHCLLLSFILSEPACFSHCQTAHQPVPGAWVGKTSRNLFRLSFQMFPCQPAAVQRLCELIQYLPPFNLSYRMQNNKTFTANSAAAQYCDTPAQAALPFWWGIMSERGEKPHNTARLLRASQTSHACACKAACRCSRPSGTAPLRAQPCTALHSPAQPCTALQLQAFNGAMQQHLGNISVLFCP